MDKLSWINHKLHDCHTLLPQVNAWKASGHTIVFTNGVFDLLHRGHCTYLAQAASLGNKLIIGVNSDTSVKRLKGAERPLQNEKDRLFQLASLLVVDAVCLFEEDTPLQLIEHLQPNVLAKGGDYTIETIVGAKEVMNMGGRVAVIPFVSGYSTTGIIAKIMKL